MTNEQQQSDDASNEVTILNPDGSVQHRYNANDVQKRPAQNTAEPAPVDAAKPAAAPTPPAPSAGSVPRDTSLALQKRLNAEAAQSAEDQADELADAIYTKFMSLLSDSIAEKGGNLTMDDVAEMGEAFTEQLSGIKETFLSAVESYTMAREQNRVSSERGNVFHRIMVHPFEARLTTEKDLKDKPDHLSRRMLPGFYNVLSMMFGPPKLSRYEQKAKTVVDHLLKQNNGEIEWEDVYKSHEMRRISLRSLIDIAKHFKNTEKRLDWMVAMVNSNMIPLEDGKLSAGWQFTRETAEALLRDLFHDLHHALQNQAARQKFSEELGADTVGVLDSVTRRFC